MPDVSIAILVGGESRRMGADKALIEIAQGGPTLLQAVIDRVTAWTDDLFLVGPSRPGYDVYRLPIQPDRYGPIGPLGAVATALTVARNDRCIVVSCDTPMLSSAFISWLSRRDDTADVVIPTLSVDGREVLQPLHARYQRRTLPIFERAIAHGDRRLSQIIDALRTEKVGEATLRQLDPELRGFLSVNTPEALAVVRAWFSESAHRLPEER